MLGVLVGASTWFAAPAGATGGGTKLWRAFYDGGIVDSFGRDGDDTPHATATSPDGTKVFVAGSSDGPAGQGKNYTTIAYNPSTGAQLWVATYTSTVNGAPVQFDDVANAIAVSPDGTQVYVTGQSHGAFATIAYNTTTGAAVWTSLHTAAGPATALTVSPDGSTVFVTGDGTNPTPGAPYDYATVAYDAATGTTLWYSTWNGTSNMNDYARAITVTPDGSRVVVTGYNQVPAYNDEYVTIAYQATTGAQLWVSRFNAVEGQTYSPDQAYSMAMSPDGSFVAVTGAGGILQSNGTPSSEFATIAYDTVTGAQRWVAEGPISHFGTTVQVAVAPDATKVYVTGSNQDGLEVNSTSDYVTIAYAADTGSMLWVSRYNHVGKEFLGGFLGDSNEDDFAVALAVSGDGSRVVVTGWGRGGFLFGDSDYATVAYDTATGAQLWVTRHNFLADCSYCGGFLSEEMPTAITIVPGDHIVIVTGGKHNPDDPYTDFNDFATAAIAL
jgi:DNA-binding beta-propeller fold protein YncE